EAPHRHHEHQQWPRSAARGLARSACKLVRSSRIPRYNMRRIPASAANLERRLMARNSGHSTTDHDEIRRWAEERNGKPSHVKTTGEGEDVGILRLDFPGYSGGDSLVEISWDQWFDKFDERGLALIYQDTTSSGEPSNFNKLVCRDTAENAQHRSSRSTQTGNARSSGRSRSKGTSSRSSNKRRRSSSSSAGSSRSKKTSSRKTGASAKKP